MRLNDCTNNMMLKLTLRKNGNSLGFVLPKDALDHLAAGEGDTVFLTFLADGALRLSKADPEFERKVLQAEMVNRMYGNGVRALVRAAKLFEPPKAGEQPGQPSAK